MSGHSVFVHVWLIFAICYYCCETLVLSARMYSLYTKGWKYWPYLIQTVMSVQAPDLNEPANSGVGTMGTGGGGTLYHPDFRTCTPYTPQVKDAGYVKILSKRL